MKHFLSPFLIVLLLCSSLQGEQTLSKENAFTSLSGLKRSSVVRNVTLSSTAKADTYVSNASTNINYGTNETFFVGNKTGEFLEAYFFFIFEEKPSNYNNANFSLYFEGYYDETVTLDFYLVDESWEEETMIWNNKPNCVELIKNLTITSAQEYEIDITEYIEGRETLSICINASNTNQTKWLQGHTREKSSPYNRPPSIKWRYETECFISVTSPEKDAEYDSGYLTMEWTSFGVKGDVFIDLFDNGEKVKTLAASTEDDGEHSWRIYKSDTYDSEDFTIIITAHSDHDISGSSEVFAIHITENSTITPDNTWIWITVLIVSALSGIGIAVILRKRGSRGKREKDMFSLDLDFDDKGI